LKNVIVPKIGLTSKEKPSKIELNQAAHVAKKATASMGKFQKKLPKEKPLKGTGKKRKFDPLIIESGKEKSKNLDVLAQVMSKKPKVNIDRAVDRKVHSDTPTVSAGRSSFRNKSQGGSNTGVSGRGGSRRREGKRRSSGPSKNDNKRSVNYGGHAKGGRGGFAGAGRGRGGTGGGRGRGGGGASKFGGSKRS